MSDIVALTHCLAAPLSRTQLRQLRHSIVALLSMTGRATMLGLSRWIESGGSYRTVQRWFQSSMDWGMVLWNVVRTHLLVHEGVYLLAGDDVVVSKAGKATHGLGRFYSSLAQCPIPGLSFLALSLVDVQQRRSYPLGIEQHVPVKRAETVTPAPNAAGCRHLGCESHCAGMGDVTCIGRPSSLRQGMP
jgi:hypothetical protein